MDAVLPGEDPAGRPEGAALPAGPGAVPGQEKDNHPPLTAYKAAVLGCILLLPLLAGASSSALAGGVPYRPVFSNTSIIYISPPRGYTGSLYVAVHPEEGRDDPSAEILLTDPQGRRVGLDPRSKRKFLEVPDSFYEYEGLDDLDNEQPGPVSGVVNVMNPPDGRYRLSVIGTEDGMYDLEVEAADRDTEPSHAEYAGVRTRRGVVHEYILVYSDKPGAKVVLKRGE